MKILNCYSSIVRKIYDEPILFRNNLKRERTSCIILCDKKITQQICHIISVHYLGVPFYLLKTSAQIPIIELLKEISGHKLTK